MSRRLTALHRAPTSAAGSLRARASREKLTVYVQKRDDPTVTILVFFPEEAKVGIKPIRRYCERMNEEHVSRAILIVQDAMTSHAKQALKETITLGLHMEHFQARAPPLAGGRAPAAEAHRSAVLCACARSDAEPQPNLSPPALCALRAPSVRRRRSCSSTSPSTCSCPSTS